jgi:hypothetical protein
MSKSNKYKLKISKMHPPYTEEMLIHFYFNPSVNSPKNNQYENELTNKMF